MDKELLRIVIIATGLLIMIGMILWSYLKGRQQDDEPDDIPHEKAIGSKGNIDESLRIHHEHDDFDIIPIGSAKQGSSNEEADDDDWAKEIKPDYDDDEDLELNERPVIPEVLQFAIIAEKEDGFNGLDVASALEKTGLKYGNLKVFERINANEQVDYGVACMLQPGTFPEGPALADFNCPGIVFYLQHGDLENAQDVFDDFVSTIKEVAEELGGEIWDHQRLPLTAATIQTIHQSL
jgi:cell division protein ZipA